jgi:hypothetical protein
MEIERARRQVSLRIIPEVERRIFLHRALVWPVCGQVRAATPGHIESVPRGIGSRLARFSCPPAPERQDGPKESYEG